MAKMSRLVIVLHFVVPLSLAAVPPSWPTARSVGQSLAKCLGEPKVFPCLHKETVDNLDLMLRDNSTWEYNAFVQFEKDQDFMLLNESDVKRSYGIGGDAIAEKLVQLAQARSIRLRVNPRLLQAEMKNLDSDEGGDDTRKYQKIWYLNDSLKGRKKKDKDKGMAMFGGLAMVAMMAQMFLGKVMLIAGSAFVMAKIALVVSLLTSLKTKPSGGGSTEHVVTYTDAGGGGGGHSGSGWHRSLPHYTPPTASAQEPVGIDHHHESVSQSPDYHHYDASFQGHNYNFL